MWYRRFNMDERTNTSNNPENKSKLRLTSRGKGAIAITAALAAGTTLAATHQTEISDFASAAQRIFNGPPAATEVAGPQSLEQSKMLELIDTLRASGDTLPQYGTDILISGPETHLYDEGLAQIPLDILNENRANIQGALLESSKTANVDQPDTPYVTQTGQVYGVYEVDLNNDGINEYVINLKG